MIPSVFTSEIFIDELARGGLRHVCIAPGSRSTPLTLACAAHPRIHAHMHLDERSAGFYALGLAMALDEPVALICTSGSAAANFYPAIVEAHMSRVPLLVLTSDRPHELRHSGANQTIDQIKMYGDFALWSVDMALPEAAPDPTAIRNLRATAARALAVADGAPKGVAHLNFPFRKPLEPTLEEAKQHVFEPDAPPFLRISRGVVLPNAADVAELAEIIARYQNGIIVCGPNCPRGNFAQAIHALSEASGYPIFAEALANVNSRPHRSPRPVRSSEIDIILRFGGVPTGAEMLSLLANAKAAHRIFVAHDGVYADDDHRTTWMIHADASALCAGVAARLPARALTREPSAFAAAIRQNSEAMLQKLSTALETCDWFDGAVAYEVVKSAPANAAIFAGNSLSVRNLDEFGIPSPLPAGGAGGVASPHIFGSRGASGIDGNVSTALGIAAADGARPVIALLGDITFYHDMNGLLAVNKFGLQNATFVVVNNDGGGIFQRLPISKLEPPFTEMFLTPHGLTFEHAAALYGLRHARVTTRAEFVAAFGARMRGEPSAPQFIEVMTDSRRDLEIRKKILGN
ncbi:MAG: 2-succinyl-5-enolpyruvyl-6-hydroxy-3-cyclohexene-1-carboxylic-acid synthase [Anaerolineae bacterium]